MSSPATENAVVIYVLTDQAPSGFIKEGTEKTDNPVHLTAPKSYRLPPTSTRVAIEDGVRKFKKTRWIKGHDEIDVEVQDKAKVLPNPTEDLIWFENGILQVRKDGGDLGLYRFLSTHAHNETNKDRPASAGKPIFRELRNADVAEKKIAQMDERAEAMGLVQDLATKIEGGFHYNSGRLDFYATLFGLQALSNPERIDALYQLAVKEPKRIIQTIGDAVGTIRAELAHAVELGVIVLGSGGEPIQLKASGATVIQPKGKTHAARMDELVNFILTPSSEEIATQIRMEMEAIKAQRIQDGK
jgi:hypothetical protein